jgi:hypothetical protein
MYTLVTVLLFVVGVFSGTIITLLFLWYWSKREQRQFNRALKELLEYSKKAVPDKKETVSKQITDLRNKLN